jgi:hypothetical protein
MRSRRVWRVRDKVTARYLSPATRNGEAIWVEYSEAEVFTRKDAMALAKSFSAIAERQTI